ncbi:MAG: HAMP domain-containing protein [Phycisphaerales bacterium]|nr:HAMP domain-containing protein [Phycisphaerales bacterium]
MTSSPRRIQTTKLGLNLSASIILWLLLTMIGVLLFLAWEARLTAEGQVNLEGDLIGSVAANTCLQPLLENDYPTIRSRLDAMIQRLPDVVFCQVDSALPGSIGAEVSVGQPAELMRWIEGDTSGLVVFLSPIVTNDVPPVVIGEVAVGYSRNRIDSALRSQIMTISIGIGASFFIVAAFLVYVVRRLIGRPLSDLDAQSARLAGGDLETPVRLDSQTEFGQLARTLESMRIQVAGQIQHLQELSQQLVRSGETQRMMFSELDHRVRNNLAGLASLITLSRRGANDVDAFAESIRGRVHAMSVVHTLLSQEHWEPVNLAALLRLLVPPGVTGRLECTGQTDVQIPPDQATACGMVIQELMANSLKYGAWSGDGTVHVSWQDPELDEDGRLVLLMQWQETGGPPIEQTVEPGTGTGLIEGFVTSELRGEVVFRYDREGVRHDLEFRLGRHRRNG